MKKNYSAIITRIIGCSTQAQLLYSSVTTPVMALIDFDRIALGPGESGIVKFKIGREHLALWNREMHQVLEPGEFKVMVGRPSADIRQYGIFWVTPN